MAIIQFDATGVPPDEGRNSDPIPPGWYIVAMEKSEMKPTKDGINSMLAVTFGVLEGQFKGRKIFFNFNLRHTNPQTVEIAYKQFSAVCHAVQHLQVNDSTELHGRPLKIKVKIRPAQGEYAPSNDIEAFKHVNDPSAVDGPKVAGTTAAAPPVFTPPPAAPQQWAPPAQAAQPQFAPPQAPQQQWAPPAQQQAPAAPAAAPAWAPPPGAPAQPWAQPAQAPAAPPGPAAIPPGAAPAQWTPPPVAPGAGQQPPWVTQQPPQA